MAPSKVLQREEDLLICSPIFDPPKGLSPLDTAMDQCLGGLLLQFYIAIGLGLILKNALDAKEPHQKFELAERWLSLDSAVKAQIKMSLLQTLSSPVPDARSTASQVIAKIAAVVQGMNSSEGNNNVRLAAMQALYNALRFAQANFTNDVERDFIVRGVCEATLSPEVKIQQAAFECLVSISSTYYETLAPYIQDIFIITAKAVREDEEPVALQAIEFWSSICDVEIDILDDYGGDFSGDSDIPCFNFIKQALPVLVPMLSETLL
ncbi:hypothetical protein HHK36_000052 [Tetracentron sinense]|uniref:Uncharacterized protein n=1 Tax=Tetracentron sinense TaxID=13715 RepID=A0A835DTN5_TETSI|nr:hypothetical protein HHK36_000052 [Tetracentron sinense]